MAISQYVDVLISRETTAVTQKGFGTALVLGPTTGKLSQKVETFTSIEAVEAIFADGDPELTAARRLFGQELKPESIKIAERDADVAQVMNVTVTQLQNNTAYSVTINGTVFTYTSDADATEAEIVAGLLAAVNGGSEPVTAALGAGDSLDLTSDVAGDPFTLTLTANLASTTTTANKNISTELALVEQTDGDWYCLISCSRLEKDILRAADFIEARQKIYVAASSDAGIFTNGTTDVASQLKDKSLDRTTLIALKGGVTEFPDAAWAGLQLPKTPGSSTWAFKQIKGVTVDKLTDTEVNNIAAKNVNIFVSVLGVNIVTGGLPKNGGIMAGGEFIDVIRGVDWMTARITEGVYSRLVNLSKIPYTNAGVAIIENEINKVLEQAITNGVLSNDPAPTITAPKVSEVAFNDRANRTLPDVKFTGTLAGAIHKTTVRGVVTV